MNRVYKHMQFNGNKQIQIKTKGNPGINMDYEVSSPKRKYIYKCNTSKHALMEWWCAYTETNC